MDRELAQYIFHNFSHLLTDVERRANRHLAATYKATDGRSDLAAQADARAQTTPRNGLSDDPAVLALAAGGLDAFQQRAATRVLTEHGDAVRLTRCPRCDGLARTPQARWCPHCGHDWHDTAAV
jgi:hypothetical protein